MLACVPKRGGVLVTSIYKASQYYSCDHAGNYSGFARLGSDAWWGPVLFLTADNGAHSQALEFYSDSVARGCEGTERQRRNGCFRSSTPRLSVI